MPPKLFYLIDDDEDEQLMLQMALEEVSKEMQLMWEPDGHAAVTYLSGNITKPDYIFIDINMPRISGWECLRLIRQIPGFKNIPIAMYSTSAKHSLHTMEFRGLASALIDKKSSIDDLEVTIKKFLKENS